MISFTVKSTTTLLSTVCRKRTCLLNSFPTLSKSKIGSVKELTFLAGLKEDGIVWGPENDVSTPVHYQNCDFKCCNSVLLTSAWETYLNH